MKVRVPSPYNFEGVDRLMSWRPFSRRKRGDVCTDDVEVRLTLESIQGIAIQSKDSYVYVRGKSMGPHCHFAMNTEMCLLNRMESLVTIEEPFDFECRFIVHHVDNAEEKPRIESVPIRLSIRQNEVPSLNGFSKMGYVHIDLADVYFEYIIASAEEKSAAFRERRLLETSSYNAVLQYTVVFQSKGEKAAELSRGLERRGSNPPPIEEVDRDSSHPFEVSGVFLDFVRELGVTKQEEEELAKLEEVSTNSSKDPSDMAESTQTMLSSLFATAERLMGTQPTSS